MEENKARRPRPRRSVEEVKREPASGGAPVRRPTPVRSAPERSAAAAPQKAPESQRANAALPKPVPKKPAPKPEDLEKTTITNAQPKVKLKTPIRSEAPVAEESSGTLNGIFKAVLYMTAVLLVSVILAYGIIIVANDVFAFVKSEEAVEVVIPEDASVSEIADILGEADVIAYPALFKLYALFKGEDGVDKEGNSVFIAGTYTVSPMKNYMQLLSAFKKQYKREVVSVTFPEGSTIEDMIAILVDEYGISTREDLTRAINEYDYGLDFTLGLENKEGRYYRLEGYLFPDTYQFYTDSSAETIVYKMLVNFRKKLSYIGKNGCEERLAELGMTLDEVVTLASIIEKEVKYAVDYDQVSSVFHNRLNNRANYPRLDSDATTVYAIIMEEGKRPESLGAEELAFDNPYNTRKYNGLPPGAIANPGYEALYCAFYPAKTNYYYFIADNIGYNLYARTLAGHNENVSSVRNEAKK